MDIRNKSLNVGTLNCRICSNHYSTKINRTIAFFMLSCDSATGIYTCCLGMSEAVDVYSDWLDACAAAQKEHDAQDATRDDDSDEGGPAPRDDAEDEDEDE